MNHHLQKTDSNKQTLGATHSNTYRKPKYEVSSDAHSYTVAVYMPGVDKKSVDIQFHDHVLTLTGSRALALPSTWRPIIREIATNNYRLELQLNVDIDQSTIAAQVENGVLTLHLPVAERAKPRKIEIS